MTTPTSNTCPECKGSTRGWETQADGSKIFKLGACRGCDGTGTIPRNPESECKCVTRGALLFTYECSIHGEAPDPAPQTEPIPTPDLVSKGEGDVYRTEQSLDEAGDSRTWTERERKIYEIGHREGESCEGASWTLALDDLFGDSDEEITPSTVVDIIAREVAKARDLETRYWLSKFKATPQFAGLKEENK